MVASADASGSRARQLNDAIADRMLEELARSPEQTIRHTVQITSFGGSGTTALLEHLRQAGVDVPETPGSFPFKHQRTPPGSDRVPPGFRVVYPYGDPRNAVVSVFRREFQGGHYRGMRLRRPPADVEQSLHSLERFLERGIDEFEVADHFDRWFARDGRAYPVLFVRYEQLPEVWPTVREFVGLPPDQPALTVQPRVSEWQALPARLRDRIDRMYGDLARRLARLAPAELR